MDLERRAAVSLTATRRGGLSEETSAPLSCIREMMNHAVPKADTTLGYIHTPWPKRVEAIGQLPDLTSSVQLLTDEETKASHG